MTQAGHDASWVRWYTPAGAGRHPLVCFAPAGSAASFYRCWTPHVPASIALAAIQYPGRENRLAEPPLEDLHELADRAATAIGSSSDAPVTLFGHSLGATMAYEVALRLRTTAALIVSGCAPPHVHAGPRRIWDDESVLADLARLGGPNHAALQHPGLRVLVLPALRADYNLTARYVARERAKVSCLVAAFFGTQDSEVTPEEMGEWRRVTTGGFVLRSFDGDHFFPLQQAREVVSAILECVSPISGGTGPRVPET